MNYIIYKLHCMEYEYVGMTKDLKMRKRKHKNVFFNKKHKIHNIKIYRTIRDNYSWDLVYFEIIEDGLTKEEATVMEDVYIRKLDPQIKLNSINGRQTKEDIKIYRKNNMEKILKNQKKYILKNREKIKKYQKKYYLKNREKKTKYYLKNREKINKRALEKIHCPLCQSLHIRANMLRHQRSIKCKKIQKKNQCNNHKNAEKL